jgi:hypothetical protein
VNCIYCGGKILYGGGPCCDGPERARQAAEQAAAWHKRVDDALAELRRRLDALEQRGGGNG